MSKSSHLRCLSLLLCCALSSSFALSPDSALISPSDQVNDASTVSSSQLTTLEVHQRATQTTVVLRLKNSAEPNIFDLENPTRLIIDLPATTLSDAMPKRIQDSGLIRHIRFGSGPEGNGNLRLVLDLAQPCQHASLIDDLPEKHQQVLTIILTPTPLSTTTASTLSTTPLDNEPAELKAFQANSVAVNPAPSRVNIHSSPARSITVVIDPGHGGKDSGAVSGDGLQEKTVVLAISRCLVALLNQQQGIKAQLTRKGDYFIGLRERLRLARAYKADLFMAVHADAFNNNSAAGASVFALSAHGATSEAARWLAERENISEFAGLPFKTTNYQLKSVLLDMSQTATSQDSLAFGRLLLQQLSRITSLHGGTVEQAGFMVLKAPDIPSVLVETGFLSNSVEAAKLGSSAYQQKIANALMLGIMRYCQQNPPPDSYFEMQYKKN